MAWLATNACNARCLHCSSNSSRALPSELSTGEALAMVDGLAAFGVVDLAISGGEPLIRRDLFKVIERARLRDIWAGVGTNGSLIDAKRLRSLAASGVTRIQVSLDGPEALHDQLRRWPGLWRRAVTAIERLAGAGIPVTVCCTVTRLNWESLSTFTEFAATLPIRRLNFSRYVPTGRPSDGLDLRSNEWAAVTSQVLLLRTAYAGRLPIVTHLAQEALFDEHPEARVFRGCQAGLGQGCIAADGAVYPCVLLPIAVGNIREESLERIWTRAPLIAALHDRDSLEPPCGTCTLRSRCGGCRAVAYAMTGRPLAADPRCWYEPSGLN